VIPSSVAGSGAATPAPPASGAGVRWTPGAGRRPARRAVGRAVLAGLAAVAAVGGAAPAEPLPVQVLHVEANEGGSSGGHAALRLGDRVFHYQVDAGRQLLLVRQSWRSFHTRYAVLENRPVHAATLDLSPRRARRLADRFRRLQAVERRHRTLARAASHTRRWLEAEGSGVRARIPVPGAGLFEPGSGGDPHAAALRAAVLGGRSPSWLARQAARAEASLRALPVPAGPTAVEPARDRMPAAAPAPGERLVLGLAWREALRALERAAPVRDGLLVAAGGADAPPLAAAERARLRATASALEASAARLLRSSRPDRGRALLVTAARHQAVLRSLAEGRWLLLDPLPRDAARISADAGPVRRRALGALRRDLRRALARARGDLGAGTEPWDESRLRRAESLAARLRDVERGLAGGGAVRMAREPVVPERAAPVEAPHRDPGPAVLEAALRAARERERARQAALNGLYGYRLIRRNCATELVREMQAAFGSRAAAERALGGWIEPAAGLHFVPAALLASVRDRYRTAELRRLASFREGRLQDLRRQEPSWRVALREGNTVTSTLYAGSPRDGHFLVFTDGAPWARPLAGALNLGWGAGQAALGLLTWPLDGGRRLVRGGRGVLFSLPELVFVNVRKGRYEYDPRRMREGGPADALAPPAAGGAVASGGLP